ncbi:MAG: hypothetical protein JSS72_01585 [Armatimonadetes bacterium]|nr:hypothetical protein [Armatimonadota bacterium]
MWVLTFIGALVVILFLARLAVRLFVVFILRAAGKALSEQPGQQSSGSLADEIHLVKIDADWDEMMVRASVTALEELGFERVAAWKIPELNDILVYGFIHREKNAYSCIYDRKGMVFEDFFCYFEGDTFNLTASNSMNAGVLDPMPGRERVSCPGKSVAETWAAFLEALGNRQPKTATPEDLQPMFEYAYKSHVAWRKGRGVTAQEVKRVAENQGREIDEKQAELATKKWNDENASS